MSLFIVNHSELNAFSVAVGRVLKRGERAAVTAEQAVRNEVEVVFHIADEDGNKIERDALVVKDAAVAAKDAAAASVAKPAPAPAAPAAPAAKPAAPAAAPAAKPA